MSEHRASLAWSRDGIEFTFDTYSRNHRWNFENGAVVEASAAPDFKGDVDRVDPEEGFVASLASCHMLTFLAIAARKRFVVDTYEDRAVGVMEKNSEGKLAVTRVVLRPEISFGGEKQPDESEIHRMHELAHEHCFIANSVKTEIRIEPA